MDNIYLLGFNIFRFFIKYTPVVILNYILDFLSWFFYLIDTKHKKIAKVNLELAYEDTLTDEKKEYIVKNCYKNLVYSLSDFIKNQGASKEEILNKITFENSEILDDAISKNKKIIMVTAHYGNWELLPLGLAARFAPLSVVGRDLDSKIMNKILLANREQFNIQVLSKNGAMRGMIKALKANRIVGLLVDQNTKESEGILVDFFGKKVRHTPSVAVLAKKLDAIIIPAFITGNNHSKFTVTIHNPIILKHTDNSENDIHNCVQEQANITQKVIEEKPENWFWLHKRWKNQYEKLYK